MYQILFKMTAVCLICVVNK